MGAPATWWPPSLHKILLGWIISTGMPSLFLLTSAPERDPFCMRKVRNLRVSRFSNHHGDLLRWVPEVTLAGVPRTRAPSSSSDFQAGNGDGPPPPPRTTCTTDEEEKKNRWRKIVSEASIPPPCGSPVTSSRIIVVDDYHLLPHRGNYRHELSER